MTEEEARAWVAALDVPRGTSDRLSVFVELIRAEAANQNLVSPSGLEQLWSRHVVDSLQLLAFADCRGAWLDIGSGAGFPGLAVAIASDRQVFLSEPRPLRAAFLRRTVDALDLSRRVEVLAAKVESLAKHAPMSVISARAVASLDRLFAMASGVATPETRWILPKGRSAAEELATTQRTWQGEFRLEPSVTDPAAAIVVATNVHPRKRR